MGESLCNDDDPEFGNDADWVLGNEGGSSKKSSKKRKADKLSTSPRVRGIVSKNKIPTSSPRSNGSGSSSRSSHGGDSYSMDVLSLSGDSEATPSGLDCGSAPKIRNKSPFDPSLGTLEPQISESKLIENSSRKKSKSSKHSNPKKSKKRQNVSQNYNF